jgi:hypothetical protein
MGCRASEVLYLIQSFLAQKKPQVAVLYGVLFEVIISGLYHQQNK